MKKHVKRTSVFPWIAGSVVVICFGLLLLLTGQWARTIELDSISQKAEDSLNVYTGDLQIELDKFEALPQILSKNPLFLQLLHHPTDTEHLAIVNKELERVNRLAETSAIYILNSSGLTLASSNWNKDICFIGEDLSFRPYFKQAIQGKAGHYFALGNTSKIRGYYFAAPVFDQRRIIGVLTVKVHLQRFEENWAKGFEKVVVTDPDGVIFITSYAPWRFHALTPLSETMVARLQKSLRYGKIYPQSLGAGPLYYDDNGFCFIPIKADNRPFTQKKTISVKDQPFLLRSHEMPEAGWTVHILSDISYIDQQVRNVVLLVAFIIVIFLLSGALLYNRRRARIKQKEMELLAHNALQEMNEQLEQRVQVRTHELTLANLNLRKEVQERCRTENELRATHEELIQAGKLAAIGQMAASITHEISQPLAAIRMFAENAMILLDEKQPEQLRQNLNDITELVIKMSHITNHLKSFARKSKATLEPVDLGVTINNVIVLLAMKIEKTGAALNCTINDNTSVLADQVRLEQVFLNIFSNALDAVEDQSDKIISVSSKQQEEYVMIKICDTGKGIEENDLQRIFEPFFTRKQRNKGLGLGLSLTKSIINDFAGRITVENHPDQGTIFTVFLKNAPSEKTERHER
jgi:two-component system C4-dicarboxylate transport sensor histidine kinase DctB